MYASWENQCKHTYTEDIGFALSEKAISKLPLISVATGYLIAYDALGFLLSPIAYGIYVAALKTNKVTLSSHHNLMLLSAVVVGEVLTIYEFIGTLQHYK